MNDNNKVEKRRLNLTIDPGIFERLRAEAFREDEAYNVIIEKALAKYLKSQEAKVREPQQ